MIPPELSWLVFATVTAAAVVAAGHALLFKRDSRAALGWVAVCLLFPAVGPLFYYLFGINRIRIRAQRLHAESPAIIKHRVGVGAPPVLGSDPAAVERLLGRGNSPDTALSDLVRLSTLITQLQIVRGNEVRMLVNGEEAYPEMLRAIRQAQESVYLATYIFETDETGRRFIEALGEAAERGVRVRVLIDGVGEFYSLPRAGKLLRARDVPVGRFLPPRLVPPQVNINLRNHRKILAVDGRTAFTGGMNIGDRHCTRSSDPNRVQDAHFQLSGPVARLLEEVFLDDWEFVTGESIESPPATEPVGDAWARPIVDGPDEELDKLANILIGAVQVARERVWIMTPYFLPPRDLMATMEAAVLRGVDVRVVLPGTNNLPYVHWASRNVLWELLQWGVRVWYQPGPFVHTKLMLVDEDYCQLGSANIDPRSLSLNFELTVEVFDAELATTVGEHFEAAFATSRELTMGELEARPLWIRLRDATCWLFSPYL